MERLIFHTSGADPSSVLMPLDQKGALLGSLHPLQTFPDIDSAIAVLPDTCIFIEGSEKGDSVAQRTRRKYRRKSVHDSR